MDIGEPTTCDMREAPEAPIEAGELTGDQYTCIESRSEKLSSKNMSDVTVPLAIGYKGCREGDVVEDTVEDQCCLSTHRVEINKPNDKAVSDALAKTSNDNTDLPVEHSGIVKGSAKGRCKDNPIVHEPRNRFGAPVQLPDAGPSQICTYPETAPVLEIELVPPIRGAAAELVYARLDVRPEEIVDWWCAQNEDKLPFGFSSRAFFVNRYLGNINEYPTCADIVAGQFRHARAVHGYGTSLNKYRVQLDLCVDEDFYGLEDCRNIKESCEDFRQTGDATRELLDAAQSQQFSAPLFNHGDKTAMIVITSRLDSYSSPDIIYRLKSQTFESVIGSWCDLYDREIDETVFAYRNCLLPWTRVLETTTVAELLHVARHEGWIHEDEFLLQTTDDRDRKELLHIEVMDVDTFDKILFEQHIDQMTYNVTVSSSITTGAFMWRRDFAASSTMQDIKNDWGSASGLSQSFLKYVHFEDEGQRIDEDVTCKHFRWGSAFYSVKLPHRAEIFVKAFTAEMAKEDRQSNLEASDEYSRLLRSSKASDFGSTQCIDVEDSDEEEECNGCHSLLGPSNKGMKFVVTADLPDTKDFSIYRTQEQTFGSVIDAWCKAQGFAADFAEKATLGYFHWPLSRHDRCFPADRPLPDMCYFTSAAEKAQVRSVSLRILFAHNEIRKYAVKAARKNRAQNDRAASASVQEGGALRKRKRNTSDAADNDHPARRQDADRGRNRVPQWLNSLV